MLESSLTYYYVPDGTCILLDLQLGTAGSVEFNFSRIWKFCKAIKPLGFEPLNLNFIHVHPTYSGIGTNCSATDINCLEGFRMAFGFSPLFRIIQFSNHNVFDLRGTQTGYVQDGDAVVESVITYYLPDAWAQRPAEREYFKMLKLLAYSKE